MLILERKKGESITIGDNIKVTVLGFNGRKARLGVDAPIKSPVHREEVYLKIKEGKKPPEKDDVGDLGRGVVSAVIKMPLKRKRRPPQSRR